VLPQARSTLSAAVWDEEANKALAILFDSPLLHPIGFPGDGLGHAADLEERPPAQKSLSVCGACACSQTKTVGLTSDSFYAPRLPQAGFLLS
jgi:hypothetical protein